MGFSLRAEGDGLGAAGSSLPSVSDGIGLSGTKALHRARYPYTGRFNPHPLSPCVIFIRRGGLSFLFPIPP